MLHRIIQCSPSQALDGALEISIQQSIHRSGLQTGTPNNHINTRILNSTSFRPSNENMILMLSFMWSFGPLTEACEYEQVLQLREPGFSLWFGECDWTVSYWGELYEYRYTYIYIYMYMYIYIYVYMYMYIYIYMYLYMCTCRGCTDIHHGSHGERQSCNSTDSTQPSDWHKTSLCRLQCKLSFLNQPEPTLL